MEKTGHIGPASKRARIESSAAPPPAASNGTGAETLCFGELSLPAQAAPATEKLHMVQDITGAWKQVSGLEGALKAKYGLLPRPTVPCMSLVDADPALAPSASNSGAGDALNPRFQAVITAWRYLTTPASTDRVVVEVEFDVSQGDWAYAPGDSIGIDCCNPPADVDALLLQLGLDPLRLVTVAGLEQAAASKANGAGKGLGPPQHLMNCGAVTLRDLVAWRVDLRSQPKKALLRLLADHCGVETEANDLYLLSSIKGKDRFRTEVEEEGLTILDLLQRYPSARPPLALLLQVLPALSPRYYSIASSPLVLPSRVRIAFSVVKWTTPQGRAREGLCTNWLHGMCQDWTARAEHSDQLLPGPQVSIFVAQSKGFKLPEDPSRPIIMVGPGTGVAPFVGFIQHRSTLAEERRAEQLAMGDRCNGYWRGLSCKVPDESIEEEPMGAMKLFFGCRRADHDFLYHKELSLLHEQGAVELTTAFSREGAQKVYVQHKLEAAGKDLMDMLCDDNCLFYVCGDGAHMAKDVRAAVIKMLQTHEALDLKAATEKVVQWERKGKYLQDIWS
eukprot:Tamp_04251.p1 GENE.Tamp_04251~~Tamp_04251.p1  ORF type:complete len:584 (-),score=99.33 Tamp_04251:1614-3296(-)